MAAQRRTMAKSRHASPAPRPCGPKVPGGEESAFKRVSVCIGCAWRRFPRGVLSGRLVSVTWPGSPGGQCWYRRLAPGHHRPPAPGHRRGHRQDMRPDRSIRTPELGLTRTPGRECPLHPDRRAAFPAHDRTARDHAPGLATNGTFIEHFKSVVKDYFCFLSLFSLTHSLTVMAGLDPAIHSAGAEADGEACGMDPGVRPEDDTRERSVGWAKRKRAHAGTGGMDPPIMYGRPLCKGFFGVMSHRSLAVMYPACLRGMMQRWP